MSKEKKEQANSELKTDTNAQSNNPHPQMADSQKKPDSSHIPVLRSGDEVKVFYKVREGGKERIQIYEGTIIAMKNSGISRSVTVRKTSYGISVERIFPLHSQLLQKIEIKRHTKVRRAKLYYLRNLKGKLSRLKELRQ